MQCNILPTLSSLPCFGLKAGAANCEGKKVFNQQPIKGAVVFTEIHVTLTVTDESEQELMLTTADIRPGHGRQ